MPREKHIWEPNSHKREANPSFKSNKNFHKEGYDSKQNKNVRLKSSHINPYNFVPFGNNCEKTPYDSQKKETLTGVISCYLTPESDFFIPNTSNINGQSGHKVMEFFSYQNLDKNYKPDSTNKPKNPVIPGSELRGMVRSMYEAFTDSCLSAFEENKELSSRTNVPNEPGILVYIDNSWKLYKTESHKVAFYDDYKIFKNPNDKFQKFLKEGNTLTGSDNVKYKSFSYVNYVEKNGHVTKFGKNKVNGESKGFLVIGESFINKKYDNIFDDIDVEKDTDKLVFPIEESEEDNVLYAAIEKYNKIIDEYYNNSKINKAASEKRKFYNNSRINIKDVKEGRRYPVWYKIVENRVYLSPSCIGRLIYQNKLTDFIRNYKPCSDKNEVCKACLLFGFVHEKNVHEQKKAENISSSVRFSDAMFSGKEPEYSEITTLKELSGPKITSMEMYTHLAEGAAGDYWVYDFFINESSYKTLELQQLLLNGRKFYYHYFNGNYKAEPNKKGVVRTDRNVTVRPMKGNSNNQFKFDVFFEHLSEEQLKKLLVVLSMRGNDSGYLYKLGMGKPLGMGSVKIRVEDVKIRTFVDFKHSLDSIKNIEDYRGYIPYFTEDKFDDCFSLDEKAREALEQLTSRTYVKSEVSYPLGKNKNNKPGEGYQWFVNNRGPVRNPAFDQFLYNTDTDPGKLYDNIDLKALKDQNKNSNNSHR